jgi:hypothetical protein
VDLASLQAAELEELRRKEQAYIADSVEDARHWIEQIDEDRQPRSLAPAYRGFNLVAYRGKVWAVARALGPLDLTALPAKDLEEHQGSAQIFVGSSPEEARRWIDQVSYPRKRRSLLSRIYRLAAGRQS